MSQTTDVFDKSIEDVWRDNESFALLGSALLENVWTSLKDAGYVSQEEPTVKKHQVVFIDADSYKIPTIEEVYSFRKKMYEGIIAFLDKEKGQLTEAPRVESYRYSSDGKVLATRGWCIHFWTS